MSLCWAEMPLKMAIAARQKRYLRSKKNGCGDIDLILRFIGGEGTMLNDLKRLSDLGVNHFSFTNGIFAHSQFSLFNFSFSIDTRPTHTHPAPPLFAALRPWSQHP